MEQDEASGASRFFERATVPGLPEDLPLASRRHAAFGDRPRRRSRAGLRERGRDGEKEPQRSENEHRGCHLDREAGYRPAADFWRAARDFRRAERRARSARNSSRSFSFFSMIFSAGDGQ